MTTNSLDIITVYTLYVILYNTRVTVVWIPTRNGAFQESAQDSHCENNFIFFCHTHVTLSLHTEKEREREREIGKIQLDARQ